MCYLALNLDQKIDLTSTNVFGMIPNSKIEVIFFKTYKIESSFQQSRAQQLQWPFGHSKPCFTTGRSICRFFDFWFWIFIKYFHIIFLAENHVVVDLYIVWGLWFFLKNNNNVKVVCSCQTFERSDFRRFWNTLWTYFCKHDLSLCRLYGDHIGDSWDI